MLFKSIPSPQRRLCGEHTVEAGVVLEYPARPSLWAGRAASLLTDLAIKLIRVEVVANDIMTFAK